MSGPAYIVFGVLYALFATGSVVFNITAMRCAPVALCSLVFCAGFIINTLCCAIFLNEKITALKAIGMIVLVASIISVVYTKSADGKRTDYKFLLYSIPAMICSGLLGITQKEFAIRFGNEGINSYFFLSFAIKLLIFLLVGLFYNPKDIMRIGKPAFIIPAIVYSAV